MKAKLTTIVIPHQLGADEARRRMASQVEWASQNCRERGFDVSVGEWNAVALSFEASGMGQTFPGRVVVGDVDVRLELRLPWLLAAFFPVLEPIAKSYGAKMLAGTGPSDLGPTR